MINIKAKRGTPTQYVIGIVAALIILAVWVSIPLMGSSPRDSANSYDNPFKSKVVDVASLTSDIPSEGGAPGSPVSGEMAVNPATSGEEIASSLFQMDAEDYSPAASDAPITTPGSGISSPSPSAPPSAGASAPKGKLSAVGSLGGSSGGSMTAGGMHNKAFGSGSAKLDVGPAGDMRSGAKAPSPVLDKKNPMMAMLKQTASQSQNAARSQSADGARGGATTAFEKAPSRPDTGELNTKLEDSASESGLSLGQAAQDLKKNDPSINAKDVDIPDPTEDTSEEAESMEKTIMNLFIKNVLGSVFNTMGTMMSQTLCDTCGAK